MVENWGAKVRFAYADPPYLGKCGKFYDHFHGDDGLCWDDPATHRKLIERMTAEFCDGWALSCSSTDLATLLPMCPDVRVAAWVKPFCAFKKGVRPCYAWEPLIFTGGRNPSSGHSHAPPLKGGAQNTPKDFLAESIALRRGLTGAKPERFCRWVIELLNVQPGDELVDLFPGTGVMGRAVAVLNAQFSAPAQGALL